MTLPILLLTSVNKVMGLKFGKDNEIAPVEEFLEKPVPADTQKKSIRRLLK